MHQLESSQWIEELSIINEINIIPINQTQLKSSLKSTSSHQPNSITKSTKLQTQAHAAATAIDTVFPHCRFCHPRHRIVDLPPPLTHGSRSGTYELSPIKVFVVVDDYILAMQI